VAQRITSEQTRRTRAFKSPTFAGVAGAHTPGTHHAGFAAFDTYIAQCHPRWLIHGHQHVNRETVIGGANVTGVYGYTLMELS